MYSQSADGPHSGGPEGLHHMSGPESATAYRFSPLRAHRYSVTTAVPLALTMSMPPV
jgi:hypothetical protein